VGKNAVNWLLIGWLVLLIATDNSKGDPALWNQANQEFAAGKFDQARADYLQLVRSGNLSPELFYNLGNTDLRLDDKGRAVLNFKRALALAPGFQPAKRNLNLVLEAAGVESEEETLASWFAKYPNVWLLGGSIFFWLVTYGGYLWFSWPRFRPISKIVLAIAIPCAAVCLVITLWVGDGVRSPDLAVIINQSADIRYGPANGSRVTVTLGLGEPVHLISERGAWTFCRTDSGLTGWLPSNNIERLVPR
jgi:tetratricopeptide (TPR) repeat protein